MLIIIGIWSISIIATILPAFGIGAYVADVSNLGVVNFQIYIYILHFRSTQKLCPN